MAKSKSATAGGQQLQGGHVHSDYLNNISLGICLVGDFNRDEPTSRQLEALTELIRYLRQRVGRIDHKWSIVKAHRDLNPLAGQPTARATAFRIAG
jgi:N-acetyl-anhydromuramyl-L-alanine amidase AmpD